MASEDLREEAAFSQPPEEPSELLEYLGIILQNGWIILAVTAALTLGVVFHHASLPNLYTATAQIIIARVGETASKVSEQIQMPTFLPEEQDDYMFDYYGTQISILQSSKIANQVAQNLGPGFPSYTMEASRVRKTSVVQISITCRDPSWAARIANTFAEIFIQQGAKEQLFITEQLLKYIPDQIQRGKDLNQSVLTTGVANKLTSFNKNLFAEQLETISKDPVIIKARADKSEGEAKLRELLQY